MKEKHSDKMLKSKTMKGIERKQKNLRKIDLGFGHQNCKICKCSNTNVYRFLFFEKLCNSYAVEKILKFVVKIIILKKQCKHY